MKKTLIGNYITSYDDMIYESGPNSFKNFMNDKYNKVHIELYNDALNKYYNYLLSSCISYEFLYELFSIMKNNSYSASEIHNLIKDISQQIEESDEFAKETKEEIKKSKIHEIFYDAANKLYNIIQTLNNDDPIKKTLLELCLNQNYLCKAYELTVNYLYELKEVMKMYIENILNEDDIKDFTATYLDSVEFIIPEKDVVEEPFDYIFKTFTLNSDTDIIEEHNSYMSEMKDYVLILEDEHGLRIGFNRKGEWIIILDGAKYVSKEGMKIVFNKLKEINNILKTKLRVEAYKQFNSNHKVIEIKNSEYWKSSSIIIISKIAPYRKKIVNLSEWWNSNYYNINGHNYKDISEIKLTKENLLDSEVIELNYISGKAKMYSKTNDITYEVPFSYLNENTVINDELFLTNTFLNNS